MFRLGQRVMVIDDNRIGTVQVHAHYYYRPNDKGKSVAMYGGTYTVLLDGEQYAETYPEQELMGYTEVNNCAES